MSTETGSVFLITDRQGNVEEVESWLTAMDHMRGTILRAMRADGHDIDEKLSNTVFRLVEEIWEESDNLRSSDWPGMTIHGVEMRRVPAKLFAGSIQYTPDDGGNVGDLAPFLATSLDAARARIGGAVNVAKIISLHEVGPTVDEMLDEEIIPGVTVGDVERFGAAAHPEPFDPEFPEAAPGEEA